MYDASTQIANPEKFTLIAVLVVEKTKETVKKWATF